jgi:hypothetical protein
LTSNFKLCRCGTRYTREGALAVRNAVFALESGAASSIMSRSLARRTAGQFNRWTIRLAISADVFENSDYDRGRAKMNG